MSTTPQIDLAVLTSSYPCSAGDGAGAFVRGFCLACVGAGLQVEVLCPALPGGPGAPADPGIRVRRLRYAVPARLQFLSRAPGAPEALASGPWLWPAALAFGARLGYEVLRRQRRRPYRAVVSHWLLPATLAGAAGLTGAARFTMAGRPSRSSAAPRAPTAHLGIAHGSDVHLLERLPAAPILARMILDGTRGLAFVSRDLLERFCALLPAGERDRARARSVVQPMGVVVDEVAGSRDDLGRRQASRREAARQRLSLAGPVALWMGRMVPVKAPEIALELAARWSQATLVMAGSGPLEAALRERARSMGERVRFAGWVHGRSKRELFAAADVVVLTGTTLPSGRTDSVPVVALEALVAGRPVVAPALGGLASSTVAGLEGLSLVPAGDTVALVEAARRAAARGPLPETVRRQAEDRLGWASALPSLLAPLGLTERLPRA